MLVTARAGNDETLLDPHNAYRLTQLSDMLSWYVDAARIQPYNQGGVNGIKRAGSGMNIQPGHVPLL